MNKVYLKDLSPEVVIKKLEDGEVVHTEDSKGKEYSYKMIKGVIVAYDESKGTVSGYNRSLYVTDKAYFETNYGCVKAIVGHWYRTRDGETVFIYRINSSSSPYIYTGSREGCSYDLTYTENGNYCTDIHPSDLVEDITEDDQTLDN